MINLGIRDRFVPQGKVSQLFEMLGLDACGIRDTVLASLSEG